VAFTLVLSQERHCCPLPKFSGRLIEEAPDSWKLGVLEKDKKKIRDHLIALRILKERGLKGLGIIGAYHARRVAPLMMRALLLYAMAPEASFHGTALAERVVPHSTRNALRRRWSFRGMMWAPPRFCLPGAGTSFDAAGTRPCCLCKFPLLMPPL